MAASANTRSAGAAAPWTPDSARSEARRLLALNAAGARRQAPTISDLVALYEEETATGRLLGRGGRAKKACTIRADRGKFEHHIVPLLGTLKVAAVTDLDIERFMHDVGDGKTAKPSGKVYRPGDPARRSWCRDRTVRLLSTLFAFAVKRKLRTNNPCVGVARFPEGRRERRLSDGEYSDFGRGLAKAEAAGLWPPALGAMRFLLLSGWRLNEVLGLEHGDVDLARITAMFIANWPAGKGDSLIVGAGCLIVGAGFCSEMQSAAPRLRKL
jgi:hypothetical protein